MEVEESRDDDGYGEKRQKSKDVRSGIVKKGQRNKRIPSRQFCVVKSTITPGKIICIALVVACVKEGDASVVPRGETEKTNMQCRR